MSKYCLLPFIALLVSAGIASAQSPEAQAILDTIQLDPAFQIELVAMEPVIVDPVDLEFDENGRIFVIEFPGYPFPEVPGRIIELIDNNSDGVYETRRLFAGGFSVGTSILPYNGGLLVASPPELLFIKDTDADGTADLREVLASGFDVGNQQHNFNGLTHGLDNWIYGASGGNGGEVSMAGSSEAPAKLRGQDFRFRVEDKTFELIGRSSGGHGLAFDEWGHLFVTHNIFHLQHLAFNGRYLDGMPASRRASLADIYDRTKGGLVRIYPIGEQVSRVNHPEESGHFSGACGITCYTGGMFPEAYDNNIFVADVVLNLVHRDRLAENGPLYKGERVEDKVEFLASKDRAFRPVGMSVGPDGALYLLDMHRDVIEHPEWIPDELEKDMDLNAGKDKGRIFRITPKTGLPRVKPEFSPANLAATVSALSSPNQWWRTTAQRMLLQWRDPATPALLTEQWRSGLTPQGRLHTLWTLQGLDALESGLILSALADDHYGVRESAVELAEPRILNEPALLDAVLTLVGDSHPRVRMRAALALSTLDASQFELVVPVVMEQLKVDMAEPWLCTAYLCAVKQSAFAALDYAMGTPLAWESAEGAAFMGNLTEIAGRDATVEEIQTLILALANGTELPSALVTDILEGVAEGIAGREALDTAALLNETTVEALSALGTNSDLDVARGVWILASRLKWTPPAAMQEELTSAREWALDETLSVEQRVASLEIARFAPFADREPLLFSLLDARQPGELQRGAIGQLSAEGSLEVATKLLERWNDLGPETRYEAGNILLYKDHNHDLLLSALESGRLGIGQLNMNLERRRHLLFADNASTAARAEKLFSDAGVVTRAAALEAMRPALTEAGDAGRGHAIFTEQCAKCHQVGEEGSLVGPNLTEIFRKSKETLLHDILDPNAAVDNEYIGYTVELKSGDVLADAGVFSGIVVNETDEEVVLVEAGGIEHGIRREEIASMKSNGLSLMPEELEKGFSTAQMADLLAFLQVPR
ncbi:MAG: c-type cytochrome [Candidatus Hydrogenedentes bacterium]|nr:c-type cytochrome [Candidatus Hydrogenedentota bacterium]